MVSTRTLSSLAEEALARLRIDESTLRRQADGLDAEAERLVPLIAQAQATLTASRGGNAIRAGMDAAGAGRQFLNRLDARKRSSRALWDEIAAIDALVPRVRDDAASIAAAPGLEGRAAESARDIRLLTQRLSDARTARDSRIPAFEGDAVYRYLSDPARARANPLAKVFDGWLARMSDFETERRKHDLLEALPDYLAAKLEASQAEGEALRGQGVLGRRFRGNATSGNGASVLDYRGKAASAERAWTQARGMDPLPEALGAFPVEGDDPVVASQLRGALTAYERIRESAGRNASEISGLRERIDVLDDLRATWTATGARGNEPAAAAVDAYASGLGSRATLLSAVGAA